MFRTQNLYLGNKNVLTQGKNIFRFRAAKFVSATHVSRAANWETVRNNVSATMFPQQFFRNNVS